MSFAGRVIRAISSIPNRLLSSLFPSIKTRIAFLICSGIFCGLGIFVFYVSNTVSYLSNDPQTCMNCHIMGSEYSAWFHSSHRESATCNDCHVPQNNIFEHYAFKGKDGMRHAAMFTLRMEPQVIKMHAAGQEVVQENCIRCHSAQVNNPALGMGKGFKERKCWECHRELPHGRVKGLASVPSSRAPTLKSAVPAWLGEIFEKESIND